MIADYYYGALCKSIYKTLNIYIDEFPTNLISDLRLPSGCDRWLALLFLGRYAEVLIYSEQSYVTYGTPEMVTLGLVAGLGWSRA
jgi:hypothetical protein